MTTREKKAPRVVWLLTWKDTGTLTGSVFTKRDDARACAERARPLTIHRYRLDEPKAKKGAKRVARCSCCKAALPKLGRAIAAWRKMLYRPVYVCPDADPVPRCGRCLQGRFREGATCRVCGAEHLAFRDGGNVMRLARARLGR